MISKVSAAKLRPLILPALACLLMCLLFLPIVLLYTRPAQALSLSFRSLPLEPEGGYTQDMRYFFRQGRRALCLSPTSICSTPALTITDRPSTIPR